MSKDPEFINWNRCLYNKHQYVLVINLRASSMERRLKAEALLRLIAIAVLILAAFMIRANSQTKVVFGFYKKTAKSSDLQAFIIAEYVFFAAASYNLLQVMRCLSSSSLRKFTVPELRLSSNVFPWISLLFDQVTVYLVFTANSAAITHAGLAVTGARSLQWLKWCNTYTPFCYRAGAHLLCGLVASFLLAFVAAVSAANVFIFYSPEHFLSLKKQLQ